MPNIYNLTVLTNQTGYMGFMGGVDTLAQGAFTLMLMALVFIIPIIIMVRHGYDANSSIHLSSLYTMLLGIVLYFSQIVTNSMYIYLPALIYVTTLGIKWYNKE